MGKVMLGEGKVGQPRTGPIYRVSRHFRGVHMEHYPRRVWGWNPEVTKWLHDTKDSRPPLTGAYMRIASKTSKKTPTGNLGNVDSGIPVPNQGKEQPSREKSSEVEVNSRRITRSLTTKDK